MDLSVVGICYSSGERHTNKAKSRKSLPVLSYENVNDGKNLPWWWWSSEEDDDTCTTTTGENQLLIYDDTGRNGDGVFFNADSPWGCTFLTRITHARHVTSLVLKELETTRDKPKGSKYTRTTHPMEKERCRPYLVGLLERLKDHSLFADHVLDLVRKGESVLPLLRLFRRRQSSIVDDCPCPCCGHTTIMPRTRHEVMNDRIQRVDNLYRSSFDCAVGIILSLLLFESIPILVRLWNRHYDLIYQGIDWLDNFPIGFKLNERLTEAMGHKLRSFLGLHSRLVAFSIDHALVVCPSSVGAAVIVGLLFGGTGLLALMLDLFRVGTLHIALVSMCFRYVYKVEFHLLSSLWLLFRGKKRNVLRKRIDTIENDSMQLLLGMTLFAIALFLFTTIFVYQTFFAVVELAAVSVMVVMAIPRVTIRDFPFGSVRYLYTSDFFNTDVYLREETGDSCASFVTCYLEASKLGVSTMIFQALAPSLSDLFRLLATFATRVVTGSPTLIRLARSRLSCSKS